MAADPSDDMLREAAKARGFRLVKSRRRKAGGDFGRYGLVDVKTGRECMGFGGGGLTASADEVLAYLRGGEVASWKRSLIGVVGAEGSIDDKPALGPTPPQRQKQSPAPARAEQNEKPPRRARKGLAPTAAEPAADDASDNAAGSAPPEPQIREATRRDAAAIAKLLGVPAPALAERIAAAIKADEPPLVAEAGGVIGIAAWTILPTLHEGRRGRVTSLLVIEAERRRGVGAALLAAVQQRLEEAGVAEIELLLDIDFDAPTAFLRRTGWERATNGYRKPI